MKIEVDVPEDLAKEMEAYPNIDWSGMVVDTLRGYLHDFQIIDKLKEFWGSAR